MEACGIVAEYNPFHNGHLLHVRETRQITQQPIIAVMSGSFMQRGEPAFFDKWSRARLAVENGVALVLELPAAFSLRSAEFFARGAVAILNATGCVSRLSCGAEHPEYDFTELARIVTGVAFQEALQNGLRQGKPYAAAYEEALHQLTGTAALNTPNDILALEYCKALLDTKIKPVLIQRQQAQYNDTVINGSIASATAIRNAYKEGKLSEVQSAVPANTWQVLQQGAGYDRQLLWQLLSYRLRTLSTAEIASQCQCSEGIENLLKQAAGSTTLEDAVQSCTNKRYPATRIRRLLMQLLLCRHRSCLEQAQPAYLRVLAFNDTGRQLLKEMKATATLPILTKLGKHPTAHQSTAFAQQLELDITASDVLSMLQGAGIIGSDYLTSPVYVKGNIIGKKNCSK